MAKNYNKEELLAWYAIHSKTADRIINDLDHSYEALMHDYTYAAKLLHLKYVVSPKDYSTLFTNNYVRMSHFPLLGVWIELIREEWRVLQTNETIRRTLAYWLLCGKMYEDLVSKLNVELNNTNHLLRWHTIKSLIKALTNTSIQNGIKTNQDWEDFFKKEGLIETASSRNASNLSNGNDLQEGNDEDANQDAPCDTIEVTVGKSGEIKKVLIPHEINNEDGRFILQEAYNRKLCNIVKDKYYWKENEELLAYFEYKISDALNLCKAMQGGVKKTNWQAMYGYFVRKDLRSYRKKWNLDHRRPSLPEGHEKVDIIFEKLEKKRERQQSLKDFNTL